MRYQIQKISGMHTECIENIAHALFVVGSGGSAKSDLLEWVRKQIPEYNIRNFKDEYVVVSFCDLIIYIYYVVGMTEKHYVLWQTPSSQVSLT